MVDKKALAIFFEANRFQQYLQGQKKLVLKTDHKHFLAIFEEHTSIPVMVTSRLQPVGIKLYRTVYQRYGQPVTSIQISVGKFKWGCMSRILVREAAI